MSRWITWFSLEISIAAVVLMSAYAQPWTLDDAYISFRYAENFAAGHGPVFNPGERVEGYTTFLWVVLLAAGERLGIPLEFHAKAMGLLFALAALALLSHAHYVARRLDPMSCALATLLAGTCGSYMIWAMSGMEVHLTAFLCLGAVLLHLRAREEAAGGGAACRWAAGSAVAAALAAMARPEAALIFVVCFLDHCLGLVTRRDRTVFVYGAVFTLVIAPYLAWRWSYYGYPVPNTFYTKVGSTLEQVQRGWKYTRGFLVAGLMLVAPALVALLAAPGLTRRHGALHVATGIVVLHVVFVVAVGGDVMPAFRFFAAILPLMALAGAHVVGPNLTGRAAFAASAALAVAYNGFQLATEPAFLNRDGVGARGKVVGTWLREHVPPGTLLATNTAGSIPYFSKLPSIDTLGLNDARIAHRKMPGMGKGKAGHEKGDGKYVLSRKPDIVQFGSSRGNSKPVFVGDRELAALPEFKRDYVLRRYSLPENLVLELYVRRDREKELGLPAPAGGTGFSEAKRVDAATRSAATRSSATPGGG